MAHFQVRYGFLFYMVNEMVQNSPHVGSVSEKVILTRNQMQKMKSRKLFGRKKGINYNSEKVRKCVPNFQRCWDIGVCFLGAWVNDIPFMTYSKKEHNV